VVSHLDADGHLHVRRTDPPGDAVRWTFTSPRPLPSAEYGPWAWLAVVDDLVLAGGESGWVLSADGEPLRDWEPSPRGSGWAEVTGDGLLVVPASGGLASEVVDLGTGASFRVEGRPFAVAVDDGSADDTLLTQTSDDELTAVERGTGRTLWSVPDAGAGASGAVVVDGRVVRLHDDGLTAHDVATGRTLWTTPLVGSAQYTLMTDGRLVLCVAFQRDRGAVLGAYGLDDGRLRWDVDLPDGVGWLFVEDGHLFGRVGQGLVAFG
jgi:PQQ-like domain